MKANLMNQGMKLVLALAVVGFSAAGFASEGLDYHSKSIWGQSKVKGSEAWTAVAVQKIQQRLNDLSQAKDIGTFCPGYREASVEQKTTCFLQIIGGLAMMESAFKPVDFFVEPSTEISSVGLLAIDENTCEIAPTKELLKRPELNLACGIDMFASLVARDHVISGPEGHRGAAAVWSSLRAPYVVPSNYENRVYHLGRRDVIARYSQNYRK